MSYTFPFHFFATYSIKEHNRDSNIARYMLYLYFCVKNLVAQRIYDVFFYNMSSEKQNDTYRLLFPYVNPKHILNGEERYMSTVEDAENTMTLIDTYVEKYREHVKNMSIADAFACLGGNTYFFAEAFREVSAYEIDETRRTHLIENIRTYYKRNNVDVFVDYGVGQHCIFKKKHDVVFLDPPWLNPQTKVVDDFVFQEVQKICARLTDTATTQYVFVKLPLLSDHESSFETLLEDMSDKWGDIHTETISRKKRGGYHVAKYTIVCARRKALGVHTLSVGRTDDSVKDLLIRLSVLCK